MTISQGLIAGFLSEVPATRRVLEAVPEKRLDYKPHEKSMTLGRLAGHVAEIPRLASWFKMNELDFAAPAGWSFKPFTPANRADLLRFLEEQIASFEPALKDKDDAFLSAIWTLRRGEKVLLSLPREAAIRSMVTHHLIHHRGQLTVYLRLLGAPVPSTYGPTADQPMP
ncbi:MAG: damage-inducible protein DinB [Candidatus Sumerlaeota bacterium]|nr:damage-inducible protein DinB [Candidatus Sumerlaeota bacterium]